MFDIKDITSGVVNFNLAGQGFVLIKYDIGRPSEGGYVCPGLMETGTTQEVLGIYQNHASLVHAGFSEGYLPIPYAHLFIGNKIFGDYTNLPGQFELLDTEAFISHDPFTPPSWAGDLWTFSRLKQNRKFSKDETLACLRGCRVEKGKLRLVIGPGLYSQSFYTMGSEGVKISLSTEERLKLNAELTSEEMSELNELFGKLTAQYGAGKTIREIIFARYGTMAPFDREVFNFVLGVAGLVVTSDKEFVFALRGKNVSINRGINVTASGAVSFNHQYLEKHGFAPFMGNEMHKESFEEIGLNSGTLMIQSMREKIRVELGIGPEEYELIPVGFVRELPRGGSPEMMFLIRYHGSTLDLVKRISANPHPGKKEIERYVYAQPIEETARLIKTPGGDGIIQHKCILNAMLALEFMKKFGGA